MVSRLREFLMDHGHEDLIGRLQRGKSIHSNRFQLPKLIDLIIILFLFTGEITLPRAAELMNTSVTNLSGLLE